MISAMTDRSTILLFSVELLGATELKARHPFTGRTPDWVQAVEDFYSETIQVVLSRTSLDFFGRATIPEVRVHKTKGEELLFEAWPASIADVADLVRLFNACTAELHQGLMQRWGVGLHGAVWMASLLGKNRAIRVPELDQNGTEHYEYVGPEIDLGFQLAPHAPAGRVIVPYELPVLLEASPLRFERQGEVSLRGVDLDPYPLWLVGG